MNRISKTRIIAMLMSVAMLLTLLPVGLAADEPAVAMIGEEKYETLDKAIAAANDGDTIELLADCTATKTFYKSLTFTGGHTVSMDFYGWRYNGDLTFDGANLIINSDSNSPVANNGESA